MDPFTALLVPLAALVSGAGSIDAPVERPQVDATSIPPQGQLIPRPQSGEGITDEEGWVPVTDGFHVPVQHQVRIERSITIRVSPRAPRNPDLADLPQVMAPRMIERRMGNCVPVRAIAGVQVSRDNRLLLFLRDRRIVSLGLEKSCRARDFYSGFYVERPSDGQICIERDRLQSRSGANCGLTRMRQLIED